MIQHQGVIQSVPDGNNTYREERKGTDSRIIKRKDMIVSKLRRGVRGKK